MARTRWPPGPVKPRPLAQARQIRPAAPVGAKDWGPADRSLSRHPESGVGRFGGQAGTRSRPYAHAEPRPGRQGRSTIHILPDYSGAASAMRQTIGLSCRMAARRALFTVFAVRSPVDRPPRERAKPRANAGRHQATPSYARRLSSLVKCPLSDTERRPATPGT